VSDQPTAAPGDGAGAAAGSSRVTELPPLDADQAAPGAAGDDVVDGSTSPIRAVTRQVAFDGRWDEARARKVEALFDELASDWHSRQSEQRLAVVRDALVRGGVSGGRALELGSGTGFATPLLAGHFPAVFAMDLATEMLRRAPVAFPRARVDAYRLPVRRSSVDAVVLINMLLFPAEVARVLAPGGTVVWVNSLGERTPIHLPAADVATAMGSGWHGVASRHGSGTWCVLRRGDDPPAD